MRRTAGAVLIYGRRPVDALYHADCGGSTSAADAIWGGRPLPYLRGTADDVPAIDAPGVDVQHGREALRAALNRDSRTAVGARFTGIDILSRDQSGRATSLAVRGTQTASSAAKTCAPCSIDRSATARFKARASPSAGPGLVHFDGAGFGHGVGLCQAGAAARARRGDGLPDILRAYFADASRADR